MRIMFDLLLLTLVAVFIAIYLNKLPQLQILQDAVNRRFHQISYHPPTDIAALAEEAQMSDTAKQIFYQTEPVIDTDRAAFNQHCQAQVNRNTVELGCYTGDNHIYILKIDDPGLQSEMVVVASHEMLHAAYSKLSPFDQSTINEELEAEVIHLHSNTLNQETRTYSLTEPGQRDNELHSLIGTEYSPLDNQLETYYSKYFTNRQTIVADHQKFQAVFDNLQAKLDNLEVKIRADRAVMNNYLRSGNTRSYNAVVPAINSLIDQYNLTADQYNALSRSLAGAEAPTATQ
jgi:hypothetical protein